MLGVNMKFVSKSLKKQQQQQKPSNDKPHYKMFQKTSIICRWCYSVCWIQTDKRLHICIVTEGLKQTFFVSITDQWSDIENGTFWCFCFIDKDRKAIYLITYFVKVKSLCLVTLFFTILRYLLMLIFKYNPLF